MSDTKDITENNAVNDGKDDSAVDNSSSGLVANVDDTNKAPSIAFGDGKIPTTLPALPPMAAPNSKPKLVERHIETYVYRDFANAEPTKLDTNTDDMHQGGRLPPQSLQSQKLPSKLSAMLSDPDLSSIITWMPHGRSWKILNRELFTGFALPRYFGHSNHASFVRIVNAWGFRRISVGVDRDSYYHELFLRGKPSLQQRMKRLPSCHRKTPVDKNDRCPDFYELAKTSPLPEVTWSGTNNQAGGYPGMPGMAGAGGGAAFPPQLNNMMGNAGYLPEAVKPIHFGDSSGAFSSNGLMGNGAVGMGANQSNAFGGMTDNNVMLSLLSNGNLAQGQPTDPSSLVAYTQSLQKENENLMLKIKLLEYENQAKQLGQQQQQQQQQQQEGQSSMAKLGDSSGNNMTQNNPTADNTSGVMPNVSVDNSGGMNGTEATADADSTTNIAI